MEATKRSRQPACSPGACADHASDTVPRGKRSRREPSGVVFTQHELVSIDHTAGVLEVFGEANGRLVVAAAVSVQKGMPCNCASMKEYTFVQIRGDEAREGTIAARDTHIECVDSVSSKGAGNEPVILDEDLAIDTGAGQVLDGVKWRRKLTRNPVFKKALHSNQRQNQIVRIKCPIVGCTFIFRIDINKHNPWGPLLKHWKRKACPKGPQSVKWGHALPF